MSEPITPRQFHESDGVDDWRVLFGGAYTHFRTGSFATGEDGRAAPAPRSPLDKGSNV